MHFSVLVISTDGLNDVDDQLEPFNENIKIERYISNELEEEEIKNFVDYYTETHILKGEQDFEKLYKQFGEDWNNNNWRKIEGIWQVTSTYNSDSKWDWYEIGGRWNSQIALKDLIVKSPIDKNQVENRFVNWRNTTAHSILIDGKWYEEYDHSEMYDTILKDLPKTALVTMVDCHI